MANRITKRTVDAAQPKDREYFLWDGELLGFGLRVLPSGVKSYVAKYRLGPGRRAPVRRVTIGKHGKLTADAARERARKILADVVRGDELLAFGHRAVPLVRVEVRSLASRALGFRAPTAGKDSAYRSGRLPDWFKKKNPDASAATREAEEDWS
jgi:Arm DNA-binding domain